MSLSKFTISSLCILTGLAIFAPAQADDFTSEEVGELPCARHPDLFADRLLRISLNEVRRSRIAAHLYMVGGIICLVDGPDHQPSRPVDWPLDPDTGEPMAVDLRVRVPGITLEDEEPLGGASWTVFDLTSNKVTRFPNGAHADIWRQPLNWLCESWTSGCTVELAVGINLDLPADPDVPYDMDGKVDGKDYLIWKSRFDDGTYDQLSPGGNEDWNIYDSGYSLTENKGRTQPEIFGELINVSVGTMTITDDNGMERRNRRIDVQCGDGPEATVFSSMPTLFPVVSCYTPSDHVRYEMFEPDQSKMEIRE